MGNSSVIFLVMLAISFSVWLSNKVEGKVHYQDFVLKENNFTRLCSTKSAFVVNGSIPGPAVYVNKGDTLYVNVHNLGASKVTFHWHGVKQPRNPWSDGPEYITQCALQPGNNFTYEVIFSDEEGTLWWHAHNEWTRSTVYGAIVIYPEEGSSYPFPKPDGEEILVLGSWYTYDVNLVVEQALEYSNNTLPSSDAFTINGQPGDLCPCGNESIYRFDVEDGKTYLVRIVNAAMNSEMFLAVANHNLTVVGVDASYVKPFVTSYIAIGSGNTIDVLLTANRTFGQYYIATTAYSIEAANVTVDNTTATAILEYNGSYTTLPAASPLFPSDTLPYHRNTTAMSIFNSRLRSLNDQNVPKIITTQMFITVAVNKLQFNLSDPLAASMNNRTWMNPQVDVLQAYYNNISGYFTEDFPDMPPAFYDFVAEDLPFNNSNSILGTEVKVLEYGEEVEIVFQAANIMNSSQYHPMHFHGHSFYVVGTSTGDFDFELDPTTYNLVDPPFMNTANLPANGWLAIRFFAVNPGVWFWHCHLDHHLSVGMATVIIVKNGPTADKSLRKPPANMPECVDAPIIQLWKSDY